MEERELLDLIRSTEEITFKINGVALRTIPADYLKPMLDALERELEQEEITDVINEADSSY